MIPCTLRQLEIFLAAAEDCHFARTANRLGISQPAVTNHVALLERQLGKQLFIRRRGTTPVLSTEGLAFLNQARSFLEEGEKINAFRVNAPAREIALVRIGAGQHIIDDYLRPHLSEFLLDHPTLAIDCAPVETIDRGFQALDRGQIDLFFFTTNAKNRTARLSDTIRTVRFCLYGAPSFADYRNATPAALSKLPFVLPPEGSEQEKMVHVALSGAGVFASNVAVRAQFSDVIVNLAANGFGVAALFETMVADRVERGELIEFDIKLPDRYRMVFRRDATPSPAVKAVQSYLREVLKAAPKPGPNGHASAPHHPHILS